MITHEDSFIFSLYFYTRRAQNNESKEHCLCIKENQNKSSQSFLRNPSTLKSPLAHVWIVGKRKWMTYVNETSSRVTTSSATRQSQFRMKMTEVKNYLVCIVWCSDDATTVFDVNSKQPTKQQVTHVWC